MKRFLSVLSVILFLFVCSGRLWCEDQSTNKTPTPSPQLLEDKAAKALREGKILLNFENTDVRLLAKLISELTKKNILLDDKVQGKISIYSSRKVTPSEAWQVFKSALQLYGYGVVEKGNLVKILPSSLIEKNYKNYIGEKMPPRLPDNYVVAVIILNNADAGELEKTLKPMSSPNGTITAFTPINGLLISDTSETVSMLTQLIKKLDEHYKKEKLVLMYPKNIRVDEVAKALEAILKDKKPMIRLTPYLPTNALLVLAPPRDIKFVETTLKTLDTKIPDDEKIDRQFEVYYLENASADEVSKIINEILVERQRITQELKKDQPAGPVGSEKRTFQAFKVSADPSTNSLILFVSPHEYAELKSLITCLDTTPKQILVSAVIAEISLKKLQEIGVRWHALSTQGGGASFQGGLSVDSIYQVLASGSFVAGGLSLNKTQTIDINGQKIIYPDIFFLLSMLNTDSEFNVLSAPRLLTMDHKNANINVGSVVPFATGVKFDAMGQPVVTYDYKDVGLTLQITPHVSQSKYIRMEVSQGIKDVTDYLRPQLGAIGYVVPILSQRQINTTVTLGDSQTIIIGGLISKKLVNTIKSVPFLSQIPGLGELFKDKSKTVEKTTLFVFITPHIIDTPEDLAQITAKYQNYIDEKMEGKSKLEEAKTNLNLPNSQPTPGSDPNPAPAPIQPVPTPLGQP